MSNLLAERRNPLAQLPHFLRNFLRRFHTVFVRHARLGECSIKAPKFPVTREKHAKSWVDNVSFQASAPIDFDGHIGRRDDVNPGVDRVA